MEINYYEEERFLCVDLVKDSDGLLFQSIAKELSETFNVEWKVRLDGLDQRYWDFEYREIILTLHLEHYLGISIHVTKPITNPEVVTQILKEIGDHFQNWRPST